MKSTVRLFGLAVPPAPSGASVSSATLSTLPGDTPGHPPEAIAAIAKAMGLQSGTAPSLGDALKAAAVGPAGRVLICGSLYLAGEVLAANGS